MAQGRGEGKDGQGRPLLPLDPPEGESVSDADACGAQNAPDGIALHLSAVPGTRHHDWHDARSRPPDIVPAAVPDEAKAEVTEQAFHFLCGAGRDPGHESGGDRMLTADRFE